MNPTPRLVVSRRQFVVNLGAAAAALPLSGLVTKLPAAQPAGVDSGGAKPLQTSPPQRL